MTPDVSDPHSCRSRPFIVPGALLVHNFLFLRNFLLIWPSNLFCSLWERKRDIERKLSERVGDPREHVSGYAGGSVDEWKLTVSNVSGTVPTLPAVSSLKPDTLSGVLLRHLRVNWEMDLTDPIKWAVLLHLPPSVSYWGKCGSVVRHAGSLCCTVGEDGNSDRKWVLGHDRPMNHPLFWGDGSHQTQTQCVKMLPKRTSEETIHSHILWLTHICQEFSSLEEFSALYEVKHVIIGVHFTRKFYFSVSTSKCLPVLCNYLSTILAISEWKLIQHPKPNLFQCKRHMRFSCIENILPPKWISFPPKIYLII